MSDATPISILDERPPKRAWTFNRKALAAVLAVVVGVPSLLTALIIFAMLSTDTEQHVAGEMTLTPDWIEITPERPLRPLKQYQVIVLEGVVPLERFDPYERALRPDGDGLRPEVVLVGERGELVPVELRRGGTYSSHESGFVGYAPDGVYVKVRVRSGKPARLRRIVWHCRQGK